MCDSGAREKKYLGDEELAAVYIITGRIARTAIAGIYYSAPDRGCGVL